MTANRVAFGVDSTVSVAINTFNLLLDAGANVNTQNNKGYSALMFFKPTSANKELFKFFRITKNN